jgi:hypothetical protein
VRLISITPESTSGIQDTKNTEASAEIAWRGVVGAGGSITLNKANSDILSGTSAIVSYSGCNFASSPNTPVAEGLFSVTLKDVVEMARSIQSNPPDGKKEVALLRHYK